MSKHRAERRTHLPTRPGRALGAVLLSAALAAGVAAAVPAEAATSISPTDPVVTGAPPVVRESSVTLSVDVTAMHYTRGSSTAKYAAYNATTNLGLQPNALCRGDLPGAVVTPRTTVEVSGPQGSVLSATSPVRDLAFSLSTPSNAPLNPQPTPSATNYRGDFPDARVPHGFSTTLDLTGRPAGVYTVTTTDYNTYRTVPLFGAATACAVGTPTRDAGGALTNTVTAGPVVSTRTFEYRPWAVQFKDVFGKGSVRANLSPREFQFAVAGKNSPITSGGDATGGSQRFFTLAGGFALPSDASACVADAASCLPSTAVECDPAAGCAPRLMLINSPAGPGQSTALFGVFDLETKAFIAQATVDGTTRVLLSLGTANDAVYGSVLAKLAADAGTQGIDLARILQTEVRVDSGGQRTSLSLLNGLQIDPTSRPGGVSISSDATVQAGVVLDIYSSLRTSGGACVSNKADSSTAPARYQRNVADGYVVKRSDLLPEVPRVGPLGPLVGGPVYHVQGTFRSDALVNTATSVIGLDTAADEPNGYPAWVTPFVSGTHTAKPRTMDFVGTGTWSASETPVLSGCLVVDFLLGTGVAVYNNPLPVGLGAILDPLTTPSPEAQSLTDLVDTAVADVLDDVTSTPAVNDLLTQIVGALPLAG